MSTTANSLHVLIVGGGIGGLTAAIALRKQGHQVEIFEQSRLATETGAAIHLAPNANGVLKRLGIFAERGGANPMERLTEYTDGGKLKRSMDLTEDNKRWQHEWLLAHRVDLHNQLKEAVQTPAEDGSVIAFHTASRVTSVDAATGTVVLADGSQHTGDVIVGADGVHSVTRSALPGAHTVRAEASGKSAFRFLVPRNAALADPETAGFCTRPGELCIWYGADRRIVLYPTSHNSVLNFVLIHPTEESAEEAERGGEAEGRETWGQQTHNLDRMLQVYAGFDPAILKLLAKADPQSVRVWKLLDMAEIPSWHTERLALLGDAAHPFLPHQGQGGGVAIEDAASLAVVLPADVSAEEVPARLALYDEIRHGRATRIQQYSRLAGQDRADGDARSVANGNTGKAAFDMYGFTDYNFGHDEWDNSTQRLREWTWNRMESPYWRMPIAFGPMPGPRQTHLGLPRDGTRSTFTTASIRFKTSRTVLQNLFPPGRSGWRFTAPDTVAYASFAQTTLNKMHWLGGSGYKHFGLYVHGVEYVGSPDGTVVRGTYMPILFESLTDPIVSGREELGMPKLYTSVDVYRREHSYRIRTGWEGAQWGNFLLQDLQQLQGKDALESARGGISGENDAGILVYKYIPKTGRQNKNVAAEEYPVFDPFAEAVPTPQPKRVYTTSKASFSIDPLDWEQLPTMHHIIARLAELPVYEIVGGKVVEGEGVPDVSGARPI
ncbi:hypothetical protein ASPZODRAFT_166563 [Penicilliopsis zonata CBS 506.65]|uniref:FAD-binding domain-containing protein n=1 Tax=Penicilliopsis zonata CBS 506.65 TaxID=1073090 RepID=A0A1L9SJX3_9EURO|nr:hypothetical protein ASPZODRAFT_166563 [Penicilliopsis zonata CBS 506.65]OJJ47364.1 hypothetical protein ASPZODRAFT_166563 [Penicilliopsis zonata CBS 506.65]